MSLPLLAAAGAAVYLGYRYFKKHPIALTTSQRDAALATGEVRTLTADERALVQNALGEYVAGAAPAPIPGCPSAAAIAGRKPAAGETVEGSMRLSSLASDAIKAGGEVFVTPELVGAAKLGTGLPATAVLITISPAGGAGCVEARKNAVATGHYLYASPMTQVV